MTVAYIAKVMYMQLDNIIIIMRMCTWSHAPVGDVHNSKTAPLATYLRQLVWIIIIRR